LTTKVSHGSVATQLWVAKLTATCPQSLPVKIFFENRSIFGEDTNNHKVGRFLRHSVFMWGTTFDLGWI